jgi:CheY-like chemotaxis protein
MVRPRRLNRPTDAQRVNEWRPEPDGTVTTEIGTLRLVVHPHTPGGYARFLMLGRSESTASGHALLASGSEENVAAAMRVAERMAVRMASFHQPSAVRTPDDGASRETKLSRLRRSCSDLSGRRVLVVEDEWVIATDLERSLRKCGAAVVGPTPTLGRAQALLATEPDLDGAVMEVNLRGQMAYPLADALEQLGIPFVFATECDAATIPERYAHIPLCSKPVEAAEVIRALERRMFRRERHSDGACTPSRVNSRLVSPSSV